MQVQMQVKSLQNLVISKYITNNTLELSNLPIHLQNIINIERQKYDEIFKDKVFKDLSLYLNNITRSLKSFRFYYKNINNCDINYLMFKIRDNPDILIELGYTKYKFTLEIKNTIHDTPNTPNTPPNPYDDQLYKLTIIEPETQYTSIYSTIVGRFD